MVRRTKTDLLVAPLKGSTYVKNSLLKKGIGAAAALCTGAAMLAFAPAAHAAPYTSPDIAVTAGGSDTIENFMGQYLSNFDGSTTVLPGSTVHTYNIPAFPVGTYTTRGDVNCAQDINWTQTPGTFGTSAQQAPSGSGAGKSYLATEDTSASTQAGCIDIGRSSSSPGTVAAGEKSTFEYYAFALDAVTWASASLNAPAILTRQQVQDIYACNITDWGTVGGTPGPIQRYLPQSGSGTRAFFVGQYGITAGMLSTTNANCPAVKDNSILNNNGGPNIKFEENQGATIEAGDIAKAILPYSAGLWSYQSANAGNPTVDVRNGVRLGGISTSGGANPATKGNPVKWVASDRTYALDTSGVVNENNVTLANPALTTNDVPGIRYVFNILDNKSNLVGYQAAFNLVGFANTAVPGAAKSPLCSNQGASDDQQFALALINSVGFAPLPTTGNPGGSNAAGATCRKFAPT
jgi:ABC-type phosphate transport system substrate-binding protein